MKRFVVALFAVGAGALVGAEPSWWTATSPVDTSIKSGAPANNAGPVNGAQLKNVAKKAAIYLDANLPGGAGSGVWNLVNGFQRASSDLAPVNLGQLKAVAKPFYDRLIAAGYDTKGNLLSHGFVFPAGWPANCPYPWNPATPASNNLAPANLGQLKMVFSFSVAGFNPADADKDGYSDAYETQAGSNPNDYFSQPGKTVVPRIFVYGGGGGWVESGNYSSEPITYKVIDSAAGVALVNAPVSVAVSSGAGALASTPGGTASGPLSLLSDHQGLVKIYFKAPNP